MVSVEDTLDEAERAYRASQGDRALLTKSLNLLKVAVILDPGLARGWKLLGMVQLELGDPESSLESADRCLAVDPSQAECWLLLGVLSQDRKDAERAIAAYESYLRLAPAGVYVVDVQRQLRELRDASEVSTTP